MNDGQIVAERVVNLTRHPIAFVCGGELRDFSGQRFRPLPRLALTLGHADVHDDEDDGRRGQGDIAKPVRPGGEPGQIAADASDHEQAHHPREHTRQQENCLCGERQQNQRKAASPCEVVNAHADREFDEQVRDGHDQVAPPAGVVEAPDSEREIQPAERQKLHPRDHGHP